MTYRLPTLNTLRAFEAAARHLSFKTAATELGVTAGAISQQVKKLEISLGVAMFRRLPHGLLLTPEGEAYLPRISQVFEDLTAATEAIAPTINSKKFNVGICSKAAEILPPNWPKNRDSLKDYVRDSVCTNDIEMVWNNEIDCLVRLAGGPYGKLTSLTIPASSIGKFTPPALHFICKPGLADCRQTKAILHDLEAHTSLSI